MCGGSEREQFSTDAIFGGEILITQSTAGYRFSVDALLLAWYASRARAERALEIGTGSAVVSLALSSRRPRLDITAIELQESLWSLAVKNVDANECGNITVLQKDFRDLPGGLEAGSFQLVFANPPFREKGRGRLNPHPEKSAARHELHGTLKELVTASADMLEKDGCLCLILLHERLADLKRIADETGFRLRQITDIQPFPGDTPNLFLTMLTREKGACGRESMAIWRERGVYTPRLEAVLAGDWNGPHPLDGLF